MALLMTDNHDLSIFLTKFLEEQGQEGHGINSNPELRKIQIARSNYGEYWDEWVNDKSCFLSPTEINVLEYFHTHYYAKRKSDIELQVSIKAGMDILQAVLHKLNEHYPEYWEYVQRRLREAPSDVPAGTAKHKFLHTPIAELKLSKRLKHILLRNKLNTPYDIVCGYSGTDLLGIYGFGKICLYELEKLMDEHKCGYMLNDED